MSLIEAFLTDQSHYAITLAFDTHINDGLTLVSFYEILGSH